MGARDKKTTSVVMLVNNDCLHDSRVIKTAESIAASGRDVTVVCRASADAPSFEVRNNVRYSRVLRKEFTASYFIEAFSLWVRSRALFVRAPLQIVLGLTILMFRSIMLGRHLARRGARFLRRGANYLRRWARFLRRAVKLLIARLKRIKKLLTARFTRTKKYWNRSFLGAWRKATKSAYASIEHREVTLAMQRAVAQLRPDIVHAHDLGTLSAGLTFSRLHDARLIYDSHELEMHRNATFTEQQIKQRRFEEAQGIRAADSVITVSESIASHLEEEYAIKRPLVVYNAPDLRSQSKVVSRNIREDAGVIEGEPLCVYVGGVTVNRGLENVIRAMQVWPEMKLATVGPVRPQTKAELQDLVVGLGLQSRVRFLDPVPSDSVVRYISDADISVLAIQNVCLSYFYCMPNKLFESVFAGLPVGVAALQDMSDFVTKWGVGVVFDEQSPQSIAENLRELYLNRTNFKLSSEDIQAMAGEFSWLAQEAKLLEIYGRLESD